MNLFIEKFKISHFLSFFGEYEVNISPYTAIMCNYYEGRDDFFRAFEFVFGANLSDLRAVKPLDLVHKALKEEFLINRDVHSYVEVTLNCLHENKQLKFSRSIKNGHSHPRIEHKISNLVTSSLQYEEKLSSLGIHIKQKNFIYYKSYFNSAIWGSAEDLERTICTCLRENYLYENWKKANTEVEYLTKLKSQTAVKDYNSMKNSHSVIAKYTKKMEAFSSSAETNLTEILKSFESDSLSEDSSSLAVSADEEMNPDDVKMKSENTSTLESEIYFLMEKLNVLRLKEAYLTSHLHHEEIKLAAKPVNASILQNRISLIKTEIQEKESLMSEVWKKIQAIKLEVENLGQKISFRWISLHKIENRKFRENRFTQYGRFYDYLQPSRYVQLLKQIIGANIFYAHLCDSIEDAFIVVEQLRDLKYQHREVFIPFNHYSHRLKDTITASGEKGIRITTLEELLIFLCKLKHYQLIDEVPVIVQKNFNFEDVVPNDSILYIQNNFYVGSDGLISFRIDEDDVFLADEKEIEKNLIQLTTEEELNYRKWNDLHFLKWKTLVEMNSLENEVYYLKHKWKKYTQKPLAVRQSSPVTEIYEEYRDIFKEYDEEREKSETELQKAEEPLFSKRDSSATSNEESVILFLNDLKDVIIEKRKTQNKVEDLTKELHTALIATPSSCYRLRQNFVKFHNNPDKTKLFFEKEFKKLKKLMRQDDLEDFLGSQEWRTAFIASLTRDFEELKTKLKTSMLGLQNIATARKTRLYQLVDHCNRYLTSTFSHILDGALPFVKLNFGPGEEKIHIMSGLGEEKMNVVDIMHFNTFLKFMSAFTLFLEIAKFQKVPFILIDDIEEYFPLHNDNLTGVLDSIILDKLLPSENPRFHLLMRVGQFLQHYIKKNTPGKFIRNNGSNKDCTSGPIQIIYFAKEDSIHAAEHCLWIQNQILPEEYLSENCNSYSGIYEINLENLRN